MKCPFRVNKETGGFEDCYGSNCMAYAVRQEQEPYYGQKALSQLEIRNVAYCSRIPGSGSYYPFPICPPYGGERA